MALDPIIPKTVANWIPLTFPPRVEKRYLVWVRQHGSILDGIIDIAVYFPVTAEWKLQREMVEGEQIDLYADVLAPFYYESPPTGSPPISPTPPT